jgi:hypothetical protein
MFVAPYERTGEGEGATAARICVSPLHPASRSAASAAQAAWERIVVFMM